MAKLNDFERLPLDQICEFTSLAMRDALRCQRHFEPGLLSVDQLLTDTGLQLDAQPVGDPIYEREIGHDRTDIVDRQIVKSVRTQLVNIAGTHRLGSLGEFH